MRLIDRTGHRYGRLIVVHRSGTASAGGALWLCRCDCGQTTTVASGSLQTGNTLSCGCLRLERVTTHDKSACAEYAIWKAAYQRCHNRKSQGFKNYGARGIRMCEAWQGDFSAFYHDMGPRPTSRHSLDRIDNDGPYAPDNCRWSTRHEQGNNRRGNHRLTFNNETHTLAEWARLSGIRFSTLKNRIAYGWSLREALTVGADKTGNRHDSQRLTLHGVTRSLPAWARQLGISASTLRERLAKWPLEEALTRRRTIFDPGRVARARWTSRD